MIVDYLLCIYVLLAVYCIELIYCYCYYYHYYYYYYYATAVAAVCLGGSCVQCGCG